MLNALPSSVRHYTERIETTVERWPIKVTVDHAIRWVLQFDTGDYGLAVRILENLDVLGASDIRAALEVAHTKLLRRIADKGSPLKGNNTLFAALGNSAKSGALIAYQYRIAVDLPEEDFLSGEDEQQLDLQHIENIVFVDDVIGTGRTVAKEVERIAEEVYTLSRTRNIFILTVAGYEAGIQHVTEATGASVVSALEYNARDTVASLDATFYEGLPVEERSAILERIKRYCRSISTSELGFGGVGGLLVFDHNTPNNTLPIVCSTGKGWLPLFQRSKKIPGAAKVLSSARAEHQKRSSAPIQRVERDKIDLTLFVEGKVDEIFVDYLRKHHNLAKEARVGEITAIALGGLYQSERLLQLVREAKKHAIFVLDDDEHSRKASARNRALADVPILYLKPNFVATLDIDKIYGHSERFPGLPDRMTPYPDLNNNWLHDVELAVLRRGPVAKNVGFILQILEEYLDPEKCKAFAVSLREKVDELLGSRDT